MKKCLKCGLVKEEGSFYRDKRSKNSFHSWCKICEKEACKEWKTNHKKHIKEYNKEYQKIDKCKEHHRKHQKEYCRTECGKKYYREYWREWQKKNRSINPRFKLDCNMGTAIYLALNRKKVGRKWEELTGYSVEELMKHLESKFEPWMNWGNYGKWHVDHIKPKSLFHYTSAEDKEFKECWSLNNLQPLEAIENIRKSNKY